MEQDSKSNTPSGQSHLSTGSTPQQGGASQSDPQPQPSSRSSVGPSTSSTNTHNAKRRRGLGIVTPNACTECRKKRAKCDGNKPCGRCKAQKGVECVYEIPVRQSKENLRTEIDQLRHRQRSSDQVFSALVRSNLWEDVVSRLRNGHSVESISDWLGALPSGSGAATAFPQQTGAGDAVSARHGMAAPPTEFGAAGHGSLPGLSMPGVGNVSPAQAPPGFRTEITQSGSPWHFSSHSQAGSTRSNSIPEVMSMGVPELRGPPQSRVGSWAENIQMEPTTEGIPRYRGLDEVLSPLKGSEMSTPSGTWTSTTSDINLVHHLLALYFCWEYPTFASLSKEHFLRDFQDGRQRFCSAILVNALLALGCRFSSQPMTRENPNDPYTSGNHFFKEALRLFNAERNHHSLTIIQALGIMSIREASCGRDSESWYYAGQSIRLAIEMGLHQPNSEGDDDVVAVKSATFWGAFALDHAWSLATGSLPQTSCFPDLPMKPATITNIEASLWVPYTDDGAPMQRSCEQPSNVRSVYKCFCELSELVHQSLYILHSPGRPLTARDLLNIYTQYLNWYDRIPEALRLGHNFTPAVLFAHMYYHFAILLLFRPLIKLRIIGSKVSPRDVCSQAADAILGLLTSYSQLYTLRRTPSFVPYFVLTSTIMHLAIGATNLEGSDSTVHFSSEDMKNVVSVDPHVREALKQGISDLTEMAPCHHFAEQALNILRYLAKKWNIDVGMGSGKTPPEDYEGLVKPYSGSLNFFAPNVVAEDFICRWGAGNMKDVGDKEPGVERTGDSMANPLFWPFPMQGRPILPSGKDLEKAGFAFL